MSQVNKKSTSKRFPSSLFTGSLLVLILVQLCVSIVGLRYLYHNDHTPTVFNNKVLQNPILHIILGTKRYELSNSGLPQPLIDPELAWVESSGISQREGILFEISKKQLRFTELGQTEAIDIELYQDSQVWFCDDDLSCSTDLEDAPVGQVVRYLTNTDLKSDEIVKHIIMYKQNPTNDEDAE